MSGISWTSTPTTTLSSMRPHTLGVALWYFWSADREVVRILDDTIGMWR
jgi:hypothetical protein